MNHEVKFSIAERDSSGQRRRRDLSIGRYARLTKNYVLFSSLRMKVLWKAE